MGLISGLIKLGLVAGASVTAYQASEKAKQDDGTVKADAFVKNFKEQAIANSKLGVDTVKAKMGGKPAPEEREALKKASAECADGKAA